MELWGVYLGLVIVRNRGFRNIWLELDSSCVFHLGHVYAPLLDALRKLITIEDWCVEVSLVYREANVCVDKLAKMGTLFN